jgi:TetR/AcrR family transcriptional regulator, tetracycline repressor protein
VKPKPAEFDLDADEIVTAAVDIFRESGLDAVSMRSVSGRLGVSPVPLYSRIGNKQALVEAIADRLLADVAPAVGAGEAWAEYAVRWTRALRARLRLARDSRLIVTPHRTAYVEASRPLIEVMRSDGMPADAAVQACRLVMWATVGFGAVESGARPPARRREPTRPGGDPGGVEQGEIDALFDLHIRYLIQGIQGEQRTERGAPHTRGYGSRQSAGTSGRH